MKALRLKDFVIVLLYGFMILSIETHACSVFNKTDGSEVLFGNVENEASHYVSELFFKPADEANNNFGHFYFFYNGNIAGGMNDQGLCRFY